MRHHRHLTLRAPSFPTRRSSDLVHGYAAFDHTSLFQDTGEGVPGMSVEPHSFRGLNGSTNVTSAFCQGLVSLNTADDGLPGSVEPGSPSFAFLVGDVLKQLFPDGYAVLPSPRR